MNGIIFSQLYIHQSQIPLITINPFSTAQPKAKLIITPFIHSVCTCSLEVGSSDLNMCYIKKCNYPISYIIVYVASALGCYWVTFGCWLLVVQSLAKVKLQNMKTS